MRMRSSVVCRPTGPLERTVRRFSGRSAPTSVACRRRGGSGMLGSRPGIPSRSAAASDISNPIFSSRSITPAKPHLQCSHAMITEEIPKMQAGGPVLTTMVLARPLTSMRALILGAGLVLAALAPSMARAQGEPRLPDLMAAGDEAFASARYDDALRSYSQVLRRDSTSAHAIFRVATLLGWRNEFDQSIGLFRKYLTLSPDDAAGRIALARVIAWSRDFPQALAMCDTMLRENPENRDAALLAAQATAWSGQYEGAAERYDRWLARHPGDAEAWNALAQVWQWCGRTGRARDALRHAVAVEPTNAAALAQLQRTDAALSASVEPGITSTDDSDENRTVTYLIRAGFAAPWNARAQADAIYRSADLGVARGTSATVRASSSWTPIGGSWTLRGGLGAARLGGDGG